MFRRFRIGLLEIEVMVTTAWEWNGPPRDELRTVFRSIVEGEDIEWSTSEDIDYLTYPETEKRFELECSKYAFINRTKTEKD